MSCTARIQPDCIKFKQNLLITCFMLWVSAILSPLSPLPSKLRGQPQAPVYGVSPLSPLVPAQNNDSGSKTHKQPADCSPVWQLSLCLSGVWLDLFGYATPPCWVLLWPRGVRVVASPGPDCFMVMHRGLTCLNHLPIAPCRCTPEAFWGAVDSCRAFFLAGEVWKRRTVNAWPGRVYAFKPPLFAGCVLARLVHE